MLMDKNQYPAAETSFRIMTPMYKQDHNLSRFLEIAYCEKMNHAAVLLQNCCSFEADFFI